MIDAANRALEANPPGEAVPGRRNRLAAAHYAAALGYLGLHDTEKARRELKAVLEASPDHPGARFSLAMTR